MHILVATLRGRKISFPDCRHVIPDIQSRKTGGAGHGPAFRPDRTFAQSASAASDFTRSMILRRTFGSEIFVNARVSCTPSLNSGNRPHRSLHYPRKNQPLWCRNPVHLQKEGNRYIQDGRDRLKAACTDAIGAFLVLLNLLKCYSEAFTEFFLTEAQHITAKTDAAADMYVNRIGLLLFSIIQLSLLATASFHSCPVHQNGVTLRFGR